ncbi:DUF5908 family protein [Telmatobacter bradus]|uniref:DUF5908 family protein n=1 Tax=Telmatobacter bradus TaxID=474953 RepID=UPI003B42CDC9
MAIEIRQLTIKSSVAVEKEKGASLSSKQERERLKKEILSECRQMMLDMMRQERER